MAVSTSIDKITRNFLWGHDSMNRKWHGIGWEKITLPKCKGGLGLRKTTDMNMAFFMHTVSRTWSNPCSLLSKMFCGKYYPGSNLCDTSPKPTDSVTWKYC